MTLYFVLILATPVDKIGMRTTTSRSSFGWQFFLKASEERLNIFLMLFLFFKHSYL